jgi:Na+-transporting NADH:ubiquinone oxidoreductase subunit NqrF
LSKVISSGAGVFGSLLFTGITVTFCPTGVGCGSCKVKLKRAKTIEDPLTYA